MALTKGREKVKYVGILAEGKFNLEVPEGTPEAVLREGETTDKTPYKKWELLFAELSGMITKIGFYKGNYGKLLQITVEDGDEEPVTLSIDTKNQFGEDILRKLLNIDLTKPVMFAPYCYIPKGKTKNSKGVSIYQDQDENGKFIKDREHQIENYFYDFETKKYKVKGHPAYPVAKKKGQEIDKEIFTMFYTQARLFMVEFIKDKLNIEETVPEETEELTEAEKKAKKAADNF